jgi:hypothetical protein
MDRQSLFLRIQDRLQRLGVPFQSGTGADFVISHTFLDAGWSTVPGGSIMRHPSCWTSRPGRLSLGTYDRDRWRNIGGFGGIAWTQSGTTLFRKVKSVHTDRMEKPMKSSWIWEPSPRRSKRKSGRPDGDFTPYCERKKHNTSRGNPLRPRQSPLLRYRYNLHASRSPTVRFTVSGAVRDCPRVRGSAASAGCRSGKAETTATSFEMR